MKDVTLRLSEEQKRVMILGLKMYEQTIENTLNKNALQEEIANYELIIVKQALTKLQQSKVSNYSLPTIVSQKRETPNEIDWKHIFLEMKQGEVGAVCVIGKTGENIQVSYEVEDQYYTLMLDGQIVIQNQDLETIMRRFKKMYIKEM